MIKKKISLILLLCFFSPLARSYPQFIGYGYNSCMACHYNPYGNGPLTDYGRALSATTVSDRLVHLDSKTESEIAEKSGFLFQEPFSKYLRPSLDYRGMRLARSVNKDQPKYDTIHMQGDVNAVIRFNGTNDYIASFTYGYAPTPKSHKGKDVNNYRSREHYVGIRPSKSYGVYVGMMDKVFGIRTPDHIAFSRSTTGLAQNDQTHGVLVHLMKKNFEVGLHPFIGNLSQAPDLRQVGASTKIEYNASKKFKPGISLLRSESEHVRDTIKSAHAKYGFSKGSSILVEIGSKEEKVLVSQKSTDSAYGFLQNHLLLRRGLFAFFTFEYFRPDLEKNNETFRLGPGVQFFPFQGVELRFDLYNTKNFSDRAATKDNWDLASQIHLWF